MTTYVIFPEMELWGPLSVCMHVCTCVCAYVCIMEECMASKDRSLVCPLPTVCLLPARLNGQVGTRRAGQGTLRAHLWNGAEWSSGSWQSLPLLCPLPRCLLLEGGSTGFLVQSLFCLS